MHPEHLQTIIFRSRLVCQRNMHLSDQGSKTGQSYTLIVNILNYSLFTYTWLVTSSKRNVWEHPRENQEESVTKICQSLHIKDKWLKHGPCFALCAMHGHHNRVSYPQHLNKTRRQVCNVFVYITPADCRALSPPPTQASSTFPGKDVRCVKFLRPLHKLWSHVRRPPLLLHCSCSVVSDSETTQVLSEDMWERKLPQSQTGFTT